MYSLKITKFEKDYKSKKERNGKSESERRTGWLAQNLK